MEKTTASFCAFPNLPLGEIAPSGSGFAEDYAYLRYWEKPGRREGVDDEKRKIQKYSFQEDNSHKTLD